jgi:hypothetical protein
MRKNIAVFVMVILFANMSSFGQTKTKHTPAKQTDVAKPIPTKQQTIQWIVGKIKNNLIGKGAFNYKFIDFDEANNILTINEKWTPSSGTSPDKYIDLHLYLNRISHFQYMEASGANVVCATYPGHPDVAAVCENSFRFQDCIDEEGEFDLDTRMEAAFITLIKFNKDEKKKDNEAF